MKCLISSSLSYTAFSSHQINDFLPTLMYAGIDSFPLKFVTVDNKILKTINISQLATRFDIIICLNFITLCLSCFRSTYTKQRHNNTQQNTYVSDIVCSMWSGVCKLWSCENNYERKRQQLHRAYAGLQNESPACYVPILILRRLSSH